MADTIVEGHINGALLKQAAEEIQTLIDKYNEVQDKIKLNNSDLQENWIGVGQTNYSDVYDSLIIKVADFGQILDDMHENLLDAAADYRDSDDDLRKDFVKSNS